MVNGIDAGNFRFKITVPDSLGNPQIITNRLGEPFIRSVVYFAEDGSILVGTEAENAALANPERAVFDWKRHMGTEKVLYVSPDRKEYRPKNTLTILLKEAKETIEAKTGEVCEEVVITIPANYTDVQKQQTIDAAVEAGLKVLLLQHEPTEAALGNGLHERKNSKALVFDLGGGTFDVSIVQTRGNLGEVIATNGEPKLGGTDFNACLPEIILEQFEAKHNYRPDTTDHALFYQDLAQRVEQVKLSLTANQQAQTVLTCNRDQLKAVVTRDEFNKRVQPLVETAMKRTDQTVKDAKLRWEDIGELYAVGGGSMPPIIAEELEKLTGKKVSRRCEPHAATAMGAVIAGRLEYARWGKDYRTRAGTLPPPEFCLREILSRTIGVAALDEKEIQRCTEILAKSTPIPSVQTRLFNVAEPNQTAALVRGLDGEDGMEVGECVELGRFELVDLPVRPDLIGRIEITFDLDASAMLTATARDIVSGKTAELELNYKEKVNNNAHEEDRVA